MKPNLPYNSSDVVCTHICTKAPQSTDFYTSHIHTTYELLFFYDGDADFIVGGAIYHLQKNDLLLVKPNVYHHLRILSSRQYERIVLSFQESDVMESLIPTLLDAKSFYHIEQSSPIRRIFDNLRDSANVFTKEEFAGLARDSLNHIFLHLKYFTSHVVKERITSNSSLETILLYVDENPALPLTISDLSMKFNLSESWIAHSFKKALGVSPSQYINRKKILYAQSLINMGVSPVQVAEMCGYVNYTTFYRQYKKYLGVSPAHDSKSDEEQPTNT